MRNKRGWIRILEATIGVLMISSVMVVVYSRQIDRGIGPEDYVYSIQNQILKDVAMRDDFRRDVLSGNTSNLEEYVKEKIPLGFGYSLRVCNLTNPPTPCKMDAEEFIAVKDKDIYVEEQIISADLEGYSPKKVKLFVWERELIGDCVSSCFPEGAVYSCSGDNVMTKTCGDFDRDGCMEWNESSVFEECADFCEEGRCVEEPYDECSPEGATSNCSDDGTVLTMICEDIDGDGYLEISSFVEEDCEEGEVCMDGRCVDEILGKTIVTCRKKVDDWDNQGCTSHWDPSEFGHCYPMGGRLIGEGCECDEDGDDCEGEKFVCYMWEEWESECSENPTCPGGEKVEGSEKRCDCDNPCSPGEVEYVCSWDFSEVLKNTCEDIDGDGCFGFEGDGMLEDYCDLEGGEICEEGNSECVAAWAVLEADYTMQRTEQQGVEIYYYFTSTISETNGVGITINSRQKCYSSISGCDSVKTSIAQYYGTNYISPNGTISNPTNFFASLYHPETMTETFWGTDDNGNAVTISYIISVS